MLKPPDCCTGLEKFGGEIFSACQSECNMMDRCCKGNCFANKLGILKDGKFDKETALKSANTAFDGDATWSNVS